MIDRKKFFDGIRSGPFPGIMDEQQVDGITRILDEWERRKLTDLRWLAYILATAKWETAHKMQPIREMGGDAYLRSKRYYPWVGEGLVQVTWEANHRKFGATKPGQMLTWPIALRAIYDGMIGGMFTGKKLAHYFNAATTDWVNARRIVNGTDKAASIAVIAKQLYAALIQANTGAAPAIPSETKPVSKAAKGAAGGAVIATGAGGAAVAAYGLTPFVVAGLVAAGVIALMLGLYAYRNWRADP